MFIELPITLIKNDPDVEIDFEKLEDMGISLNDEDFTEVIMDVLLNMDWILRINSDMETGGCALWLDNGMSFYTPLTYAELKKKLGVK